MPKKVYELAKELDIGAIDLVEKLKSLGFDVKNHMVTLTDEQSQKAIEVYNPPKEASTKKKKKKVTKKKVAKKKVVKKVTKKVAKKASSSSEPDEVEKPVEKVEQPVEAKEEEKTTVVKKRKVVTKKKEDIDAEKKAKAQEKAAAAEEAVYKEKMHAFTPIYVPTESEKAEAAAKKEKAASASKSDYSGFPPAPTGAVDDDKKDNKKRMGDLAAAVSKKGGTGRAQDITKIRAEEEMKLASTVLGRQVYTPVRRKKVYTGATKQTEITEVKDSKRVVIIHDVVTASDLAQKLSQKFESFKNQVLDLNLLIKEDDYIGEKLANKIASLYDYRVENRAFDESKVLGTDTKKDDSALAPRNPIITVMGHVDHGKTTLLDFFRKSSVTEGEAGGITQHIGAYSVKVKDSTLTFLDTPGHAAFGSMRQRGANVTDIVILVVAADDGVMPQTKESIKFAKNAGCPIIVAINKMDKEGANPERVKQELTEFELVAEDWGGDTMFVPVSALNGDGMDNLLESIKLQAEMMELKSEPKGKAEGVIIESKIEKGRGPVATVLVQKGTLKKGDSIVCGETYGRARSLMDHAGNNVSQAGPSVPVQILGLDNPPSPGDSLNVVKNEREAKKIAENRAQEKHELKTAKAPSTTTLEDFFSSATGEDTTEKKILNLIIRADVQGSYEAIVDAVEVLGNDEVGVTVLTGGVGAISDNDVMMAANSGAIIFGFNMRPVTSARRMSEEKGVEIRTYSIIYELINDVTMALEGMLEPERVEKYIGRAEVRDTFNIPKVGTIAGSAVIDGKIERGCNIRLLREGKIIYDGKLTTLKRFKEEVKSVTNGYECGMALENFNDIQNQDLIEAYILEEKKRKLDTSEIIQ